jgi:hypothetical protein
MMQGDESGAQQPAQDESGTEQPIRFESSVEATHRNLGHVVFELAQHAGDGAAAYVGGYAAKTVKEKVFGGHDKGGGKPAPPSEQPPSSAE